MDVFPTLLWVAFAVYVVERFYPLIAPILQAQHPKPSQQEPIPGHLLALAGRESEPWAREQVLQTIREHYDELRDWDRVAQRMGE